MNVYPNIHYRNITTGELVLVIKVQNNTVHYKKRGVEFLKPIDVFIQTYRKCDVTI